MGQEFLVLTRNFQFSVFVASAFYFFYNLIHKTHISLHKICECVFLVDTVCEELEGDQQFQTPVTTSPSASSSTSFMSSSLEDTTTATTPVTTATTPVTDAETAPASESPGVMPLSLLRYTHTLSLWERMNIECFRLCFMIHVHAWAGRCSPATRQPPFCQHVELRPLPSHRCPLRHQTSTAGDRASHHPSPSLPEPPAGQVQIHMTFVLLYISGGPLSALTCCVNVRLLSAIKKISPLIYSQSWVGSWVYTTQAMMTFTLIF